MIMFADTTTSRTEDERIDAGVALLDSELGKHWESRINLEVLDITTDTHCILAQLYEGDYWRGIDALGIVSGIPYGFCPNGDEGWLLTRMWRARIQNMRDRKETA